MELPKIKANISISPEIWAESARMFGGERSSMIESYLRNALNAVKNDASGVNIELLKRKRSKLVKNIGQSKAELDAINQHLNDYEELKQKREEAELLKQKEKIESISNCSRCGAEADREFKNKPICKTCFMSL